VGQNQPPEGYTVETDVAENGRSWNPGNIQRGMKARLRALKVYRQMDRQHEGKKRNHEREHADIALTVWDEQQQSSPGKGNERHKGKNDRAQALAGHRAPIQTM